VGILFWIKSSPSILLTFDFGSNLGPIESVGVELMMTSMGPGFGVFFICTLSDQLCSRDSSVLNQIIGLANSIWLVCLPFQKEGARQKHESVIKLHHSFPPGAYIDHSKAQSCNIWYAVPHLFHWNRKEHECEYLLVSLWQKSSSCYSLCSQGKPWFSIQGIDRCHVYFRTFC